MDRATASPDKNGFQAGAWHYAALIGGNLALALGPWLVRLADTGPVSAAFWRLLLPLPLLALLAWRGRSVGPLDRKLALLCMLAGTFFTSISPAGTSESSGPGSPMPRCSAMRAR